MTRHAAFSCVVTVIIYMSALRLCILYVSGANNKHGVDRGKGRKRIKTPEFQVSPAGASYGSAVAIKFAGGQVTLRSVTW
jgi:hypothetical protein